METESYGQVLNPMFDKFRRAFTKSYKNNTKNTILELKK